MQRRDGDERDADPDPVGREQVPERPGVVAGLVDGRPLSRSPRPTPMSSGIRALPAVSANDQVRRQGGESDLPRYSKLTPRAISATSTSSNARYSDENMVAYHAGEGGEDGRAGDDQPHLVAVPEGTDRVDRNAALDVAAADHAVQHPDAQVEALEHEEPGPQHRMTVERRRPRFHSAREYVSAGGPVLVRRRARGCRERARDARSAASA